MLINDISKDITSQTSCFSDNLVSGHLSAFEQKIQFLNCITVIYKHWPKYLCLHTLYEACTHTPNINQIVTFPERSTDKAFVSLLAKEASK